MSIIDITVITEGLLSRNGAGFLVPLIKNNAHLRQYGVNINIRHISDDITKVEGDCIIVESQGLKGLYRNNYSKLTKTLQQLKRNTDQLIFFDLNDDSCTGYFDLLPYVDKYCKSYVLRDRTMYMRDLYGGRLWTDFYHNNRGIIDDPVYINCPVTDDFQLKKITKGYLLGLVDYSAGSIFTKGGRLQEILRRTRLLGFFLNGPKNSDFIHPDKERLHPVSCRINTQYSRQRDTLAYHRNQIASILKDRMVLSKVSRKEYLAELGDSKIVISPFGWGEINVARDYEVAMSGALLMKPDLQHMETYPDIFNERTTVQFKWDLSDLLDKIEETLDRYDEFIQTAQRLQETYRYYMMSKEGREEFCLYIRDILTK